MSAARKSDLVDVDVQKLHETPDAYLVTATGNKKDGVWLPKSQAELEPKPNSNTLFVLTLPEWLAAVRGLV